MALARSLPLPTSGHPLIGRAELLEELRTFLERTASGKGRGVLLVGETGVGKSTLVAALAEDARREGFVVLEGRALPREIPQPFEPVKEAFRGLSSGLVRESEGAEARRDRPRSSSPASTTLLPLGLMAWSPVAPRGEAELDSAFAPERLWDALDRSGSGVEQDRLALFDRLTQSLHAVAQRHPVLFILEDVHLADDATLEFLRYLLRQSTGTSVAVLLTSIPLTDLSGTAPEVLGGLANEGELEVRTIRPLNVDEVRDYLRLINAGEAPDPQTVTRLYAESEGNPLFLERLALGERGRGAPPEGGAGPSSVGGLAPGGGGGLPRRSLTSPLESAGELGNKLLVYGAVLGHEFPFAAVVRVAEGDEEQIASALEKLVRAGVLSELPGEVYAFRNAREREALLASLTETRRRRLHRRLAEVIEVLGPDASGEEAWVRELAVHFHQGRHDLRSFEYNRRLFELVRHAGRIGEAREALERALESLRRMPPEGPSHRAEEREVLLRLGEVLAEAGDLRRAEEELLEAFSLFAPEEPRAAVELALARTHLHQGRYPEARRRARAVLPSGKEAPTTPEAAEAAGILAEAALALGDLDEALRYAAQALRVAEGLSDHRAVGTAARRLGDYYLHLRDETERARALYQRAYRLFEEEGETLGRIRLELPLAEIDFLRGRIEEGFRRLDAVARWSEEQGAHLLQAEALLRVSHHALATDALERSEKALAKARLLVPSEDGPRFDFRYALLEARHAHRKGEHERGRQHLTHAEDLARTSNSPAELFEVLLARAEAEIARGETEPARRSLEEAQRLRVQRGDLHRRWRELNRLLPTPASGASVEPAPPPR